jgi:hypothetical protein
MKRTFLLPVLLAVPLLGAGNGSTAPPAATPAVELPTNPPTVLPPVTVPEEMCKTLVQYDEAFVGKFQSQMLWIAQGSPVFAVVQDYLRLKQVVAFHCPPVPKVSEVPVVPPAPAAAPTVPVEAVPPTSPAIDAPKS